MSRPNKAYKIGLLVDDGLDKPDGVQQYVLAIGDWLHAQGHTVHYLVGQTSRTDIANVHSLSRNIKVSSNGNRLSIPLFASRRKLKAFLKRETFDIIHVQTPYSPMMGEQVITLAAKQTAVIGTFHILPNSRLITLGSYVLGLWCRISLRRFDAMLSVSPAARVFAKRTFGVESTVLPNVVDYPRFRDAKPLDQYNDDTLTILFLGRLVPRKGCSLLLQAVAELARETGLPKFRVVICGRGPLEQQLRSYCAEHDMSELVEFVGFVDEADKPRYYASADIAVFPSSGGESFGIVLLEAMASGRAAALAGNNPGYRSVMSPQPELLFDPKQPDDLVEKLRILLLDTKQRSQFAAWGKSYTEQFDVDVVGTKILAVYEQALQRRHKL